MLEKQLYSKYKQWIKKSDKNAWIERISDRFIKGIPDILVLSKGKFIALEIKANHSLQEIQRYHLRKIVKAGGLAFYSDHFVIFSLKTGKSYDINETSFKEVCYEESISEPQTND